MSDQSKPSKKERILTVFFNLVWATPIIGLGVFISSIVTSALLNQFIYDLHGYWYFVINTICCFALTLGIGIPMFNLFERKRKREGVRI